MVKSAKGRDVNMGGLRTANQYAPAIGNAHQNARGDILGKGGKVIKKREDIVHEYNTKVKNAAISVPMSEDLSKSKKPEEPKNSQIKPDQKKSVKKD